MLANPVNGNLLLTGTVLHLRGVGQVVDVAWRYNGLNDARPTLSVGLVEAALQPSPDGSFTYVAPDGGCYTFIKSGTIWTTPAGINATLSSPNSWAFTAAARPAPTREHYLRRRERGDGHPAALRHLFNRMLGQLHHCLATGQTYDPIKAFPHAVTSDTQHATPTAA
ncbi:MAG: hypothetical protein ACRDVG_07080 [Jatrophihabitantaceae bacterium]